MNLLTAIVTTGTLLHGSPSIEISSTQNPYYSYVENQRECLAAQVGSIVGIMCKGNGEIPGEKNNKFDCKNLQKGIRMCLFSGSLEELNNFGALSKKNDI